MPSPIPHLPEEFVSKLNTDPMMVDFESQVFSPEFHTEGRLKIVNSKDSFSPDQLLQIDMQGDILGEYTYLHVAALLGDPLLVCEMLRLGADVDVVDRKGITPLLLALQSFRSCRLAMQMRVQFPAATIPSLSSGRWTPAAVQRFTFIIRTLVEQHANVNRVIDGETPLHYACQVHHWETIALLLKHGANPSPDGVPRLPITFLSSARDKSRFLALTREYPPNRPRPLRMCPCWSGKTLAECHTKEQSYPPQFYCKCGSKKSYAKCCGRRNMLTFEKWDEEERWIRPAVYRSMGTGGTPGATESRAKTTQDMMDVLQLCMPRDALGSHGLEMDPEYASRFLRRIVTEMSMKGLMDPAYAFAIIQSQFLPRPQGRTFDKDTCIAAQNKWNHAVDEYISLGRDRRRRIEIERAAKIGRSNGALYRRCEGANCKKQEGKDIDKLVCCSKCKIAVYCGRVCQSSVWKTHKSECTQSRQREQALPMQRAIDAYALCGDRLEVVDRQPSAELQALLAEKQSSS